MKISGNADKDYPAELYFGLLHGVNGIDEIPIKHPFEGEWGEILSNHFLEEVHNNVPDRLDMVYLSIVEKKFYSIDEIINVKKVQDVRHKISATHLVIGMGPYGFVCLWIAGPSKSVLIDSYIGKQVSMQMEQVILSDPQMNLSLYFSDNDLIISKSKEMSQLSPFLFPKYMQQYACRYKLLFERWDSDGSVFEEYDGDTEILPQFDYIEEALFDGTFDKLHDGGLLEYHKAGKPKKLAVKWHIGKSEYTAYFWFEDEKICDVFERFYGAHPETETDFIIRIDAENRKYELSLYRYGLKEPKVIPEDVYQLIVFKNRFEDYRSDNYNQERGAWIW